MRRAPVVEAPTNLWAEDGEFLWIRADLCDATRAKRIAFVGHDPARRVVLPETYLGGERYGYDGIYVSDVSITIRPGEPDEEGWAGKGAETWWRCDEGHSGAVLYWCVTA